MAAKPFYNQTNSELFDSFNASQSGLSESEAASRLKQYGLNRLTPKKQISALAVYLAQFQNSLILTLIGAAVLIFIVWYLGDREQSDIIEGSLILAIVFLITILGFFQEWKAEKAVEALKKLMAFKAKVRREGEEKEVDVTTLVPGDIVILEEGAKVPADIRLIEVAVLGANEASLTGESAPVTKTVEPIAGEQQIADQKNMTFAGTVITQGRGVGIVTTTGDATEIGKIAQVVAEATEEETPIQRRLNAVGKTLSYAVLGISIIVFIFIVFFAEGYTHLPLVERILQSFIGAIALAVAAIPEGLPAVVTISLALGTQRMLKRQALVRKLNSIETLGSTDTICSDKTGTLTKGEMTVREIFLDHQTYEVSGTGYETEGEFRVGKKVVDPKLPGFILEVGAGCNNAKLARGQTLGDPTEVALLVSAAKAGIKPFLKRIKEIPFSSERKMMSVIVEKETTKLVYTKGAPEVVLSHCQKILLEGKEVRLTEEEKQGVLDTTLAMSQKALRTLGFAYKKMASNESEKELEQNLVFLGLQGMIDPPRTEVAPLIKQCHDSGIRVIMITGDHAATATAVAHEIGIVGPARTGEELDKLSEAEFEKAVSEVNIYARVNPNFKMRIIEALKKEGHIVAMTGDGVNDAPALKKADIGVAMGITGTDVAKEASDMVLLDDHFNTIVSAIEEGRGVFDNIQKFVNYLLSCNIGEVVVVFLAIILFHDIPLTATMLLWINVITDGFPAVALGMDPAEQGIMGFPPKRFQSEIIDKRMWFEMVLFSLLLSAGVLGIYWLNLGEGAAEAKAAAFMAIVIYELVRVIQIRADYKLNFWSNRWFIWSILVSFILQLAILYIPALAKLFDLQGIDLFDWLFIILSSAALWIGFDLARGLLSFLPRPEN